MWRDLRYETGVVLVDTYAAGCISTYLEQGSLDVGRRRALEGCVEELDRVADKLSGDVASYFTALHTLCRRVLDELPDTR